MQSVWIGCVLSFLVTCGAVAPASRLAWRIGAIDRPGEHRRMHRCAIPRIGGVAILLGFFCSYCLLFSVDRMLLGGLFLMLVGVLDDVYTITPGVKLLAQITAALLACGVSVSLGGVLSIFWVVLLCNAHNFIDGIDGLLAGCAVVESTALSLTLWTVGSEATPGMLLGAACLAFRVYNRHPARIFAGDCGSMCIGYFLAVLSMPLFSHAGTALELLSPLFLFAYPITDLTTAVMRRVLRGKSPFCADRGHLHHRICDGGVGQIACGRILIGLCVMLASVGVLLSTDRFLLRGSVLCVLTVLEMALVRRAFFGVGRI